MNRSVPSVYMHTATTKIAESRKRKKFTISDFQWPSVSSKFSRKRKYQKL